MLLLLPLSFDRSSSSQSALFVGVVVADGSCCRRRRSRSRSRSRSDGMQVCKEGKLEPPRLVALLRVSFRFVSFPPILSNIMRAAVALAAAPVAGVRKSSQPASQPVSRLRLSVHVAVCSLCSEAECVCCAGLRALISSSPSSLSSQMAAAAADSTTTTMMLGSLSLRSHRANQQQTELLCCREATARRQHLVGIIIRNRQVAPLEETDAAVESVRRRIEQPYGTKTHVDNLGALIEWACRS